MGTSGNTTPGIGAGSRNISGSVPGSGFHSISALRGGGGGEDETGAASGMVADTGGGDSGAS